MNNILDKIVLIDDSEPTNFLHKLIIDEMGCAKECIAFENAEEALEYLKTSFSDGYAHPDLIFLDINMPGMNGWEFLEEYNLLPKEQKAKALIFMLTTSLNPDDRSKAESFDCLNGFNNKPLTEQMIKEVIKKHFPERL